MKKNRLIAIFCCACVLSSGLTACGKSSDTKSSGSSETANSASSVSDSQTEKKGYEAKYPLSNKNADEVTSKVYDYICENFGTKMLSAQQESTWVATPDYEVNYIQEVTGKYPAIRGLDYMNGDFEGVNERAKSWWDKGGLVTICWHTGIDGKGYDEASNDVPDFDALLTEGTEENKKMLENWDKAANALQVLQAQGVPVLWRPFHEFDGQWFWWGKGTSEDFIKLWKYMYDKFTNEYKLNNLIWVLGYSGEVKDNWYVGDDYCDIIGSDTYDNSTNLSAWKKLQSVTTAKKPIAFHECGNIPAPEEFEKDGDIWSWFMCWHTDHIMNNDKENLKKVYNSDLVITLDELPKFNEE